MRIGNIEISNSLPFVLIAGPCQIETLDHALFMAEKLLQIANKNNIGFIYKSSFDKANRTSAFSGRGPGIEKGMKILSRVKHEFTCPIITDVHTEQQCAIAAETVDILQIPAFLCRQTDLLKAAAQQGRAVNVKKGQFLAPWDMKNVYEKLKHFGAKDILLTERGTCHGYNRLVSDMRALPIMASTGAPVIFDATHSVQEPGGIGTSSGGNREFVTTLARAAVAVGVAAIFTEAHQDPDNAPSDGPCMLNLDMLSALIEELVKYDRIRKADIAKINT